MELTKKNSTGEDSNTVLEDNGDHLPPTPSAPCAQLNLVKQLNLFLELEALIMNGDMNEAAALELESSMNENASDNSDDFSFNGILDELDALDVGDDSLKSNQANESGTLDESLVFIDSSLKRSPQQVETRLTCIESNGSPVNGQSVDFTVDSGDFAITADIEDCQSSVQSTSYQHGEQLNSFISTLRTEKLKPLIPSYFYDETSNAQYFSSATEPLVGREWVFKDIEKGFQSNQVCVLVGSAGTGKTKLLQHLFKQSSIYGKVAPDAAAAAKSSLTAQQQKFHLSPSICGAHFCLSDDTRSLEPTQLLHNLAWSLCNYQHFYNDKANLFYRALTENGSRLMKNLTNKDALSLETDLILKKCIVEPMESAYNQLDSNQTIYFLIDGLDSIPGPSSNSGSKPKNSSLAVFLVRNLVIFPKWFRFLITVRSEQSLSDLKLAYDLDYRPIHLNTNSSSSDFIDATNGKASTHSMTNNNHSITKDLNDYIAFRINKSLDIQKNILYFNTTNSSVSTSHDLLNSSDNSNSSSMLMSPQTSRRAHPIAESSSNYSNYSTINKLDSGFQIKFTNYLSSLCQSSFLFAKLTLDLIEKGCLIIKSSNFKVLPKNIDDLCRLYFNLKFSSRLAYDRLAAHIFSLCLGTIRPLTLDEIYDALNCAYVNVNEKLTLNDLLDQMNSLDGFLISFKYFDADLDLKPGNTTIRTPLYTFAHTAIRDWWFQSGHNMAHNATMGRFKKTFYDPRWGNFLLSMRLFRSSELKQRLNSLTANTAANVYLNLINHLIRASTFMFDSSHSTHQPDSEIIDKVSFMLSIYLPNDVIGTADGSVTSCDQEFSYTEQFYTSLLVSPEFLTMHSSNVFRVLVKLGADLSAGVSHFDNTPFICVLARLGYKHLISILINEFGCRFQTNQPSYQDANGTNVLCYAVQYGHIECSKLILDESKAQTRMLTEQDANGMCVLTYLATGAINRRLNMTELMAYFIEQLTRTGDLEQHWHLIQQCLVLSAMNNNQNILRYLLNSFIRHHGSNEFVSLNVVDTLKGETSLTVACSNGHKAVCELLIEGFEASVTAANAKSWTPLLCAVKSGQWEIVEYLLSRNSQIINQADKHGRDSLILAASEGHLVIIDILIEKGADLDTQDRDGLSALSWACLKGHYNAALTLLKNGVDINHVDFSGRTSLDLATFYGDVRLVQMLLERGAQIEHVDNIGMRPLDRAIGCRNVPIVVCFLKKGAKLGPATWAMAAGKPEIIITLLNKLVEDGNTLYRKGNYIEALHRYSYTLKKFPKDPSELAVLPENVKAIVEMKFNLLLNLARCHRKLNEYQASIELCSKAIEIKHDSYEAFYSRARAKRDLKQYKSALEDLDEAMKLCSTNNDVKKLINKINDEMNAKTSGNTLKKEKLSKTKS